MNLIKKLIYNNIVPLVGRIHKGKNKYVNVIYYHDIVKENGHGSQYTDIATFKKHMEYISKNGYKTFTFDELDNKENLAYDKKAVLITFDDGWASNYTEIFEYMKEKGIKYNIFLEGKNVGTNPQYLTWDMVKEMYESGIVGFGAHTYNHPSMADVSLEGYADEVSKTNEIIKEQLGYIPKDFCYPFGYYSKESNEYLVKNSPYERIYTSDLMFSYEMDGKIIFGRSSINNDESFRVFKNKLKARYNVFKSIRG